ncbi:MAG: hypothetical protein J5I59_04340 [Saprospiraceae bacterium]|nr:hypothetical protein [Saprospiraceae bacterium]
MKRIGVIYYSQTGQLKDLIDRCIEPMSDQISVDWMQIVPVKPFPFPWTSWEFFDAMPECVHEEGVEIRLEGDHPEQDYDLLIFAFQPWFLHPSLPVTGFLQSQQAADIFRNKKVITIIGARNMWLNALEKVKGYFHTFRAQHVGNISFVDSSPNLVSTLTIIRWLFKGKKESSGILPSAGIQAEDKLKGRDFGKIIEAALISDSWENLQDKLLQSGAVKLRPGLILLERTGVKQFKMWSEKIKQRGEPGSLNRKSLVLFFKNFLIVGIFVVSPVKAIVSKIQEFIKRKRLAADLQYFKSVQYIKNRI